MIIAYYFGHNNHPLPPVIEPGRTGNISRYCHDQRIAKPLKSAPVVLTLAQRNEKKHAANKDRIMHAIRSGVTVVNKIADHASVHAGTVWNHIKPLEEEGLISINRDSRPWTITPARKKRK